MHLENFKKNWKFGVVSNLKYKIYKYLMNMNSGKF